MNRDEPLPPPLPEECGVNDARPPPADRQPSLLPSRDDPDGAVTGRYSGIDVVESEP